MLLTPKIFSIPFDVYFFFPPKIPRSVIYSIISDGLTFLLHFFPLKFLAIMKAQNHEMSTLFELEEYIC